MLFRRTAPRLQDGDLIEVDGHRVRLRVRERARRVSLRLDPARREVVATAPSARRLGEAAAFAETRAAWIAQHLTALPEPRRLVSGAVIAVAGSPCRLERAAMRIAPRLIPATAQEPMRLLASGEGAAYARAAQRALRAEALVRLTARTAHHCAALNAPTPQIALQDARGRWGSCLQPRGDEAARIRYNWRLVMAPAEVLDYVAAHECAHLIEANHSAAYWAVLRRLYGDPAPARRWLKLNGAALHAVG